MPYRPASSPLTPPYAPREEAANDNTRSRVPLRYVSPCCPEGWSTVWGYLALTNPGLIEIMDKDPAVIEPDEAWLVEACEADGVSPVTVPACLWLQAQGITTAPAFPVGLLERRLG